MSLLTNLFYIIAKKHSFLKWYNVSNTINFVHFRQQNHENIYLLRSISKYIYILQFYLKVLKLDLFKQVNHTTSLCVFIKPVNYNKHFFFLNSCFFISSLFHSIHPKYFLGIFYKSLLFELIKFNNISMVSLPTSRTKETILRSPFVFKKGREQYKKEVHSSVYSYSSCLKKTILNSFQQKMFKNSFFKHKYQFN